MMARKRHGTLYLGVTNDLSRRAYEHRQKQNDGFTAQYGVDRLVWYEEYDHPQEAVDRERSMKKWRRSWKVELIEAMNPSWADLYEGLA